MHPLDTKRFYVEIRDERDDHNVWFSREYTFEQALRLSKRILNKGRFTDGRYVTVGYYV
jgi:hypothetical protein